MTTTILHCAKNAHCWHEGTAVGIWRCCRCGTQTEIHQAIIIGQTANYDFNMTPEYIERDR